MGGIAAIFVVSGIDKSDQLFGIGIAIAGALVAGYLSGLILSAFGRRSEAYEDSVEFLDVEA